MECEQLRELLRRRPFEPFCLRLHDGRTFDIQFPKINLVTQTMIMIGVPEPGKPDPFYDYVVPVDLDQVAEVVPLPEPAAAV